MQTINHLICHYSCRVRLAQHNMCFHDRVSLETFSRSLRRDAGLLTILIPIIQGLLTELRTIGAIIIIPISFKTKIISGLRMWKYDIIYLLVYAHVWFY